MLKLHDASFKRPSAIIKLTSAVLSVSGVGDRYALWNRQTKQFEHFCHEIERMNYPSTVNLSKFIYVPRPYVGLAPQLSSNTLTKILLTKTLPMGNTTQSKTCA